MADRFLCLTVKHVLRSQEQTGVTKFNNCGGMRMMLVITAIVFALNLIYIQNLASY